MGDRWYNQMKESGNNKPKRRLKADIVNEIKEFIDLKSLDKMTVADLEELLTFLKK